MTHNPLVSVVFPMKNVSDVVLNSLATVQDQTYEHLEIICVDDGSTDQTPSLVRTAMYDERIVLIEQENEGLGGARNTGIGAANGDYILFVDSDDWILPDMVRSLVETAVNGDYDIVRCLHCMLTDEGKVTSTQPHVSPRDNPNYYLDVMAGLVPASACGRLYRSRLLKDSGIRFPRHTVYEDLYVTYRLYHAAERVEEIPDPMYVWNVRPGSLSRSISMRHVDDKFRCMDDAWQFLSQNGLQSGAIDHFYRHCGKYLDNLFSKDRQWSNAADRDAVQAYMRARIESSPFFSERFVESLSRTDPALLDKLRGHPSFRAVFPPAPPVRTPPPSADLDAPGITVNVDPHKGDPLHYITLGGMIVILFRKLFRRR